MNSDIQRQISPNSENTTGPILACLSELCSHTDNEAIESRQSGSFTGQMLTNRSAYWPIWRDSRAERVSRALVTRCLNWVEQP